MPKGSESKNDIYHVFEKKDEIQKKKVSKHDNTTNLILFTCFKDEINIASRQACQDMLLV